MSRKVHLLKFYMENPDFINKMIEEEYFYALLCRGKQFKDVFVDLVNIFNKEKNISVGPEFFKGLSFPRLKMLMALVAQKEGLTDCVSVRIAQFTPVDRTPTRFQEKFYGLLVYPGIWLLGTVIEDSLSEDPLVNCGNPFEFLPGDLGYWWAAVVIMDWNHYFHVKYKSLKGLKEYDTCDKFYYDPCISRKYKYCQDSSLASLGRNPQQFLSHQDMEYFSATIKRAGFDQEKLKEHSSQMYLDMLEHLKSLKLKRNMSN